MVKGRISEFICDDNACRPVIVNFENGELQAKKAAELFCGIYTDETGAYVPALASEKVVYSNKVSREEDLYYQMLAVRNKKTNKIRLVALDNVTLKATPVKQKEFALNKSMEDGTATRDLNKMFGSKKTQRHTEQSEKLRVNVEAVREELEKTVNEVHIDSNYLEPAEPVRSDSYLPPINLKATVKEDVYNIKKIVPSDVLESLTEEAERVLSLGEDELELTDYVKGELLKLKLSDDTIDLIKILLLLDSLLRMTMLTLKQVSVKSFCPCAYSDATSQFLLNTFTSNSERNRTRSIALKQKAICYIVVLSLICGDYVVSLETLAKALKMSIKKLQEICRALLLTTNKGKKDLFILALPLPKAPSKESPKKAKGKK